MLLQAVVDIGGGFTRDAAPITYVLGAFRDLRLAE